MIIKQRNYKKSILVVASCLLVSGLAFGTAYAYQQQKTVKENTTTSTSTTTDRPATSQAKDTNAQVDTPSRPESKDTSSAKDTATLRSDTSTPDSSAPDTRQSNQSTYGTGYAPQPAPQVQAATCNETMKSSYASYRDSRITAENARWANQVNGFASYASANGMAFSGYVQDQINQYKPAHDATLSSINLDYQSSLASINCS